jgi:hypothetical protein
MVDERGRDKNQIWNSGRRVENGMRDNYQFILSTSVSHLRCMSKTIFIPEDLCCQHDCRTCRSRRGILDVLRKFRRKLLGCAGLLIGCHSTPRPSVSRLRVTSYVLWQHLDASYPSQACVSMDSNLAATFEVLGVVDELLMNPVIFHVNDCSLLINGRFD